MVRSTLRLTIAALLSLTFVDRASATWSLVALNRATGEVAVVVSTCIENFDAGQRLPVIRVGVAAGVCQGFWQSNPVNRRRIFRNSLWGATPQQLLDLIEASDGGFQDRTIGIVAFAGLPVSHTGNSGGPYLGKRVGSFGDFDYAIQGGGLSGANVLDVCEAVFISTPGDMGQRMLAAMEASRDAGGDGRCSCATTQPTSCGSPPPNFTYASYCAFMAVARPGDDDAACLSSTGCAAGDYYLRLNYSGNQTTQEPIARLRSDYDAWRAGHVARPDHVRTEVVSSMPRLQADGQTKSRVHVRLRDVDGSPLAVGGQAVTVMRAAGPEVAQLTNLVDHGDGSHSFDLVATTNEGVGEYAITVDDGVRPVQLYPLLTVESVAPSELHIGESHLSASAGTPLPLVLDRGSSDSGASYRVLASLSGTQPGTVVGGVHVPLNRDRLFDFTAGWPGGLPFTGNAGVLDAGGRAEARLGLAGGVLVPFVGSTMAFSAVIGGQAATPVASILVRP
ncbi:MAG: DUF1028 domain-containing protein [Planctomycetota bacterium]|nr:DUF1028 domain-containing protein [Planctomycetota bacterium]